MSASAVTPRTAAAERVSLGAVLSERNIWLLFVLGFATGLPVHSAWHNNFARIDLDVDKALFLSMIGFGTSGLLAFAAAPFLDRYRVPGIGRFGHRKSWVAAVLFAAVILLALLVGTKLASQGAAMRFGVVSGMAAMVVSAVLWIAIDALRIDLYRGRTQAAAISAQYLGALASAALLTRLRLESILTVEAALACAGLLIVGLGAVLFIREPGEEPVDHGAPGVARFAVSYVRPWTTFFTRNGRATGLLLIAIAFYALASSTADFLGQRGYLVDLLRTDFRDYETSTGDALSAVDTQTTTLTAIGIVAGMVIAFAMAPARAFLFLMLAIFALLGFFVLCKIALGFTVFTVAGLYLLRTLVWGGSYIIYITIAARLTARPDTAGHVAILSVFSGVFWITDRGLMALATALGSYWLAAGAAVATLAAVLFMRIAAGVAKTERTAGD